MILQAHTWLSDLISGFCFASASFGCLYLLVASVLVLHFPRPRARARRSGRPEPVTILKPLHGAEPKLARRLLSLCDQLYEAPVQIVCGVQDRADSAIAAVKKLMSRGPAIELEVNARRRGSNPKVSNLANMLPRARHDVLVMADSDIEVGPDYLAKLVAELQRPGVGAVTCLYHGVPANGLWSRQAALAINTQFLPNAVLALSLHLARPCFGSTIAMRRAVLRRIGGFELFADCLADDYALGEAVRAAGYKVAIPAFSIGHACFEDSLRALLAREIRAARTIKTIDPVGYFGTILIHPLPMALIGALSGSGEAVLLAAIAVACRVVLCLCVERAFGVARQPYWLIPVRDLLSFVVYVSGLFGSSVTWRGFAYRLRWDGRLMPNHGRAQR